MKPKINPEFLPIIEWWEKDGKQIVSGLLLAAIVVGGWYGWKHYRAASASAASADVVSAYTAEELETAVAKHSGSAPGEVLRIRLAKKYFDEGRYEEALAAYEELAKNAPDGFADIPVVGRAQCLEAMSRFEEAGKAFDAFAEANPSNYLALTAQLGAARCLVQAGDREKALARISALKEANKDDGAAMARIESVEDAIKRYETPAAKAAPSPEPAPAPAAKPAEPAPAPAAKPAEPAPKAEPAAKPAEAKQ